MVFIRALVILVAIGLWVGCVVDVIRSNGDRVNHLPRLVWLVLVLFVPLVGSTAWLLLGRPAPLGSKLGASRRPGPLPPDESPEFLARLDEEIRRKRRADELRKKLDEPPGGAEDPDDGV